MVRIFPATDFLQKFQIICIKNRKQLIEQLWIKGILFFQLSNDIIHINVDGITAELCGYKFRITHICPPLQFSPCSIIKQYD